MEKRIFLSLLCFWNCIIFAQIPVKNHLIQIVFTSDAHYGITRNSFRGHTNVEGHTVNSAMIHEINTLPGVILPNDGGINSGKNTGAIDYVIEGGDIANRMEIPHQSAAISWAQFDTDYIKGITLQNHLGAPTQFFMIPGNHDITDAIGFYRPMKPITDATSMVNIYNLMMKPSKAKTIKTYDYKKDKINYSKNIGGIHFMFITLWPDSSERIWMKKDLATISTKTPVIIFTHDQPECEAKHFTNPVKVRGINATDKFEDLLEESYKDGMAVPADEAKTVKEQQGWVNFLKRHKNIKAYFHGNDNFNQYYNYKGPDGTASLPVFRVDSPMKGKYSSKDETKLSFQLVTIDTITLTMTVRECLWNTDPAHPGKNIQWGESKTMRLK
jgi:hypothetical protein